MSDGLRRALATVFDPTDRRYELPTAFYLDEKADRERARLADKSLVHWYCLPLIIVYGENAFEVRLQGTVPGNDGVLALLAKRKSQVDPGAITVRLTVRDAEYLRELAHAIGGDEGLPASGSQEPWHYRERLTARALRKLAVFLEEHAEEFDGRQQRLF